MTRMRGMQWLPRTLFGSGHSTASPLISTQRRLRATVRSSPFQARAKSCSLVAPDLRSAIGATRIASRQRLAVDGVRDRSEWYVTHSSLPLSHSSHSSLPLSHSSLPFSHSSLPFSHLFFWQRYHRDRRVDRPTTLFRDSVSVRASLIPITLPIRCLGAGSTNPLSSIRVASTCLERVCGLAPGGPSRCDCTILPPL